MAAFMKVVVLPLQTGGYASAQDVALVISEIESIEAVRQQSVIRMKSGIKWNIDISMGKVLDLIEEWSQ